MLNFRRRLASAIFRDERQQLAAAIDALAETRHYIRSPQALADQLSEMDAQVIDLILQQSGFTRAGGQGGFAPLEQMFTEQQRQSAVADARWMYHHDVLTSAAVDMWTDFGFGQHVTVTPNDPKLAEIFDEFWTAPRNRSILGDADIHANSQRVLADGEIFAAIWASTLDGQCTVRRLETDRISDVICDPADPDVPLWYVQNTDNGQIYYADWRATPDDLGAVKLPTGAKDASELRTATRVVIVPIQRNRIGRRGWPQIRQALIWARAYRDFIGDRATVAKKAAMHVEKLTVKNSGQRQVDEIVSRLQSSLAVTGAAGDRHATTAAGQTWVQNESADLQWMNRDTGAGAAQIDGLTIASQFAAGARVPLHWLGRSDAMQNRAVAKESSLPWYEQVQRYQTFWSAAFADLVEVVGRMANEYGQAGIDDFTCEVGMDSPFNNDVSEISQVMSAIGGAVTGNTLDPAMASRANTELVRLALQSLGLRDAATVVIEPEAPATGGSDNGMPSEYAELFRQAHGESDAARLAMAIEKAAAALQAAPATAAPVTIITGPEGTAMLAREAEPPTIVVNVPEQAPPQITVNLPQQAAPVVNVAAPPAPVVNITVPEQAAPIVNVASAPAAAPAVNITVPEQAAPQVVVEAPVNDVKEFEIERDRQGRVLRIVPRR
jgi:hypothetical protein